MLEQIYEKITPEEKDFLRNLIARDELTGLFNRGFFNKKIEEEVHRATRSKSSLCLMIADIDNFKYYQDNHEKGHIGGDEALQSVAKNLVSKMRDYDIICRYGGEEIVAIRPETTPEQGKDLADRVREWIQASSPVTISMGIAGFPKNAENAVDLIYKADRALYVAKTTGKNKVVAYTPDIEI